MVTLAHAVNACQEVTLYQNPFGGNRLEGIYENQVPTPSMGGMGVAEDLFLGRVETLPHPVNYIMLRANLLIT